MQTPSHLLITAFAAHRGRRRIPIPLHVPALLIGSVLPDVAFWLLTILGELYFLYLAPLPGIGSQATAMQIMEYLHFDRFFNDPLWIASHNLFHSLIVNTLLAGWGYWMYTRGTRWGLWLFWLGVSMWFHTFIDILTHSSDGPLFLFPLSWSYRFRSPVSYWETESYGLIFMVLEYTLDLAIIVYGIVQWRRRRVR